MSAFRDALEAARGKRGGKETSRRVDAARRWIFVPYDQMTDRVGPLAQEPAEELGIVVVESLWKPRRRPYHKQKLAFVLASLRHFALEQSRRGVAVRHVFGEGSYRELLEPVAQELGPLRMMQAAEYELREDLRPLVEAGAIEVVPNETWLTTPEQFERAFAGGKAWRMDAFYRRVRKDSGILMQDGRPIGGKLSFDAENRKRWRGEPPAPEPPEFPLDAIKKEVVDLVEERFADHPGRIEGRSLPATQEDAEALWAWALKHCLPHFGPYQDAMSTESKTLFHSCVSAVVNNGRLLPRRLVAEVEALDIPLSSKEGFIRQVLGWREFMRHVHVATDGFRTLAPDGRPSALNAHEPLPPAFWGEPSGLHCLDRVVEEVWETGYGHHITRLMVLANLATLLAIEPREVTDWFWVAYVDAYDWVVEPNVLGMGTFALGDLFVTKPYVSGAAYIHKMSDYCKQCAFSPKRDCPITSLYWDFLARNQRALQGNPRLAMPLRSLAKRSRTQKTRDRRVREWTQQRLARGEILDPEGRP
ncbi:MAG: cryptochrome/photolyase family protein [Deltaproteobacteria bacterium]|jgi:deoxyribodipyrimidine photolyase-related protein|nr:cryptochrome/photolyase family protein [Deltaproteobacteria bacterium]MBW2496459.1 cryptochrome/photolyase family protein [Deltaproteobacteria bacterium]